MKPDKGNGIVIVDRGDFLSKRNDILSDASKFMRLSSLKETLKRKKTPPQLPSQVKERQHHHSKSV